MKLSAPLTMAAVAELLGWSRRRTVRYLEKVDGEVHGMLLIKRGTGPGRRYWVTKAALRRALPDLFECVENLTTRVEALEDAQKTEIARLNTIAVHLGTVTRDVSCLKIKRPGVTAGGRSATA